jgi:SecD/SecF fusion protein
MSPVVTFSIGLLLLVLFFWYFATDYGTRKRLIATALLVLLVVFSVLTIYPPQKKISLGLDIKGGTSFLLRLAGGERPVDNLMLDQAVEVIRQRVDKFGGKEPVIGPVGTDRILVQIPGLEASNIQEARTQLSKVAQLEFRLVYPDNGERLRGIDAGTEVIPPEYRVETYHPEGAGKAKEKKSEPERILVKKKADLGGDRVTNAAATFGNEGWAVDMTFDSEGAKIFGDITEKFKGFRFAIVLDGEIQSAPVIRDASTAAARKSRAALPNRKLASFATVPREPSARRRLASRRSAASRRQPWR